MLNPLLATWLAVSASGTRITVAWDAPGQAFVVDAGTGKVIGRETAPAPPRLTAHDRPRSNEAEGQQHDGNGIRRL